MRTILERIPIPMAGLSLGLAALGNLLVPLGEGVHLAFGALAFVIWLLVMIKIVRRPDVLRRDLKNPIIASVSGTIFMTAMQLAVYAEPFLGNGAFLFWLAAVSGHAMLIIWFTRRFFRCFELKNVFPTYFITYVGIAVAAVTAPAFDMQVFGRGVLGFALVSYAVLFVLVSWRYHKHPIPLAARPLFCIYTAPMSLCLTGYLAITAAPSPAIAITMGVLAQLLYLIVLCRLPRLLHLPFYPSYAAFTFPFVITATGLSKLLTALAGLGMTIPTPLWFLAGFETLVAAWLVGYTLVRYLKHLSCGLHDAPEWAYEECRWCCT